jgi:hypothetical protein
MAKHTAVMFSFDKTTDGIWLGMFTEAILPAMKKEVGNTVIASLRVKEYSLSDHQFIQIKLDIHNSEVIFQLPRRFVAGIVEGTNPEKLGF